MFSLLPQLSSELQHRVTCCSGFLHTAVSSYIRLLQVYLNGLHLKAASNLSNSQVTNNSDGNSFYTTTIFLTLYLNCQVESFQILSLAKRFLLRVISQTPPTSLSSQQLKQVTYTTTHTTYVWKVTGPTSILFLSSGMSSWSLSVKTWTQMWQQLSQCT